MDKIFKNKKIAVLGLGIEGKDAVNFLLDCKAKITVLDKKPFNELDTSGLPLDKVKIVTGSSYLDNGLKGFDLIVRSPGFYRYHPAIIDAEKKGTIITSVVKLFFDHVQGKTIGVTGTKGKGTTSTLIYKILKNSGRDVHLAGNIGSPMLSLLQTTDKNSIIVLELSSFQLIDLHKSPNIAVVLNITQDHLDWHKDIKEYVEAKKNIVSHQTGNDFAVINHDYETSLKFASAIKAKVYYFSRHEKVEGCYVEDGKIYLRNDNKIIKLGDTAKLLLRGEHNWENVTAAVAASIAAGVDLETVKTTVYSFKGLEHRLELVREVNGVKFYNDSFSTNPQTTIAAVNSFKEPMTVILGGSSKGLNYDEMAKFIAEKGNVRTVVVIGEIAQEIHAALLRAGFKGMLINLGKCEFEDAVRLAYKNTPEKGVVVLSPATASFDMFPNYKERGKQFKIAVERLK